MSATVFALVGPLALLAALALNAVLIWRSAPGLVRALSGVGPVAVRVAIAPDGETNVVLLRPGLRASAHPLRAGWVHPLAA